MEEMEPEAGSRRPERMADPKMPDKAEVEEHRKSHLPYRNWCKHCVRGRGVEAPPRRQKEDVGMPELHFDFIFMGEESRHQKWTILVVKEKAPRC